MPLTTGEEAVCLLLDRMDELGIEYMVVGSFSSNAYGIARATKDADFVIQTDEELRCQLLDPLPGDFVIDQQVTFETVTGHRRQILKLPKIPYVIELFDLSEEPFDLERFRRRRESVFCGHKIFLPSAEDVIVQKLRWAARAKRPKDLQDAADVMRVQGDLLDWTYITRWCAELDASPALVDARRVASA